MKTCAMHALGVTAASAIICAPMLGANVRYRAVLVQPPIVSNVLVVNDINEAGALAGTAGSSMVNPGYHATLWEGDIGMNLDATFTISEGQVINDAGVVAGVGSFCPPLNGPCTGFIARALPGGSFELMGTLGGPNGQILDINSSGDFAGWWYDEDFRAHALLVTESAGVMNLGTLGGFSSRASAINDAQQVVGDSYTSSLTLRAFLWQNGRMSDLGTLGGASSGALDINNAGIVVGWATSDDGQPHAFRHSGGAMQDLQTLPGAVESRAVTINEAGMIAGVWKDAEAERLFLHTDEQGTVDLGSLDVPNFIEFGAAIHMNSSGIMVGTALFNSYQQVAWFWSPDTGLRDLQELVVNGSEISISFASGVNSSGQIAVTGTTPGTFQIRAAVLEPVAAADVNADGLINVSDLLAVIASWGQCGSGAPCDADVDGSGTVDVLDLLAVISAWD